MSNFLPRNDEGLMLLELFKIQIFYFYISTLLSKLYHMLSNVKKLNLGTKPQIKSFIINKVFFETARIQIY